MLASRTACIPQKNPDITLVVSFINGAPAYGHNYDIVNLCNHTVWNIKRARQLNVRITFALGACCSKPAININFVHVKFHRYTNIGAPICLYESKYQNTKKHHNI